MWLVYSSVLSTTLIILFASVTIKYLNWERLLTFGLFCPISWESNWTFIWCCLLVYSVGLVFISLHISSKRFNPNPFSTDLIAQSNNDSISHQLPNSLTRLRNHLTFLPIIHFIQQHTNTTAGEGERRVDGGDDGILSSLNDPTAHSKEGSDKEYLLKLEFQRDSLIEAILDSCISPWYERISDDKTFLLQSKKILQAFFDRLVQKFHQIDRTNLAKEMIELTHFHWKNYCEAASKLTPTEQNIGQHFKFVHGFIGVREELSKHYETLLCHLLKEFIISDLQSTLVCQFLSGILVKGFVLYYIDLLTDPNWINTTLKKLVSSGCSPNVTDQHQHHAPPISAGSSQESLFDFSPSCKMKDDSNNDSIKIHNNDSIDSTNEGVVDVFSPSAPPHSTVYSSSSSSSDSDLPLPQESDTLINKTCTSNNGVQQKGVNVETLSSRDYVEKGSCSSKRKNKASVPSVSAALGGLLSATALPLLPEGSGYNLNLNGLESQHLIDGHTSLDDKSKIISAPIETSDSGKIDNDKQRSTTVNKFGDDEVAVTTIETLSSSNAENVAEKVSTTSSYRHYSLGDSPKVKTILSSGERETKSLDETKENCRVARQEEFDINYDDDSRKLQLDHSSSYKQDISPMYDEAEAEDFATTIAKLRTLLEQRESQKNLMENVVQNSENETDVFKTNNNTPPDEEHSPEHVPTSPSPHPQPMKNSSSADSTRPSLNSQSSASSLGSDASSASSSHCSWDNDKLEKIVDELEESNNPVLNRFFLNVSITKTETCNDSSSGQFVLYCIQYEGVYVEENDDGQLEKLVLRTTTIKRRFQEFLHLQSQLEESSVWRPHVKGKTRIGRSWILSENTNLSQRKLILQRYLHQLCYNPVLGFCPHLRKFMAYGEEGFQPAFGTSDTIPLHRFDKLAKKFTVVLNSLRDALPSFENDLLAIPSSPDGPGGKSPTESKAKSLFASFLRAEKLASSSSSSSDSVDESSKPENNNACSKTKSATENTSSKSENKGVDNFLHTEADIGGQKISETLLEEPLVEGAYPMTYPLALAATNLLCDVLWLPQHRPQNASVSTFLKISGKSFESYLQDCLEQLLNQDSLLGYLDAVTAAIRDWSKCDELTFEKEVQYSETDLKNCLKQKIPVWVAWMWGRNRVDNTIDRLTKGCQDINLNHELILSLVELLFSKILETNNR